MPAAAVELVVVDWDGPAPLSSAELGRLLALGTDVVLVASARTDAVAAELGDSIVCWPRDGEVVDRAQRRFLGPGAPADAIALVAGPEDLSRILATLGGFPTPTEGPGWRLDVVGAHDGREREVESWLTVGNGRTGTRGSLEQPGPDALPALYVAGLFGRGPAGPAEPELAPGPAWARLAALGPVAEPRRTLDLRQGVLFHDGGAFRTARFASLADRRILVLQAEGAAASEVEAPAATGPVGEVEAGPSGEVRVQGRGGAAVWFAASTTADAGQVARIVAVDHAGPATGALAEAVALGPAQLLGRHRRAWRERWRDADVVVAGDAQAQRDLRFALYHLVSAADPESDRASVGARALTGPGYRGHVFWDTEIFVLPFFIWTHPPTARALLAYRHRTLPAARAKAARLGYEGALFAWESTDTGEETTPAYVLLPNGHRLTVLTGVQEHHIAADVAWAVWQYWQVTGDDGFVEEMGAEIVVETARFWASRAAAGDDGRHHIREVIGPDEYHEGVDDNAFTNVMARWNLRAAGALCDRFPGTAGRLAVTTADREQWARVAAGLDDGPGSATGLTEQFAGFFALEDVRAVDLAPRPFTGELVVGVERLPRTQVVKQTDVLMLGVLLPDEVDPAAQAANYAYYEPRTCHGSSLSPAIHALVAARVGDPASALDYFHLAGGVDLDNRMGNAADGVHIATMGGLWQAAVFGFGGVRADGDAVRIDPRVPASWDRLAFPVGWRGARIQVDVQAGQMELDLDGPALVAVGAGPPSALGAGRCVARWDGVGWSWAGRHDGMAPVNAPDAPSLFDLDAVIFDMDGVVTDTAATHAAAWKRLFDGYLEARATETGVPFVPFDGQADYERYVDGKNRYDGVRSFLESRGIVLPEGRADDPPGTGTVCAMGNDKDTYFLADVRENGVRPYPSTVRVIHDLRANGVAIGLVSASRNAPEVLAAAAVSDLFDERVDGVVAARMHLPGKPDPATFLEAARRLGVRPARAAVVEDALSGVAAGRAGAFALVVGVARAGQQDALRRAGADVAVADLAELER